MLSILTETVYVIDFKLSMIIVLAVPQPYWQKWKMEWGRDGGEVGVGVEMADRVG